MPFFLGGGFIFFIYFTEVEFYIYKYNDIMSNKDVIRIFKKDK